jgi:hypothetical protein
VARSGAIRRTSSFVISLAADRRPGATFAEQSTELSLTIRAFQPHNPEGNYQWARDSRPDKVLDIEYRLKVIVHR